MVRKRRGKKLPVPERQPVVRQTQPSMDFVFDELANGRRVKTLTVVDDCSKEVVQIAVDTSIPALYVTRVLDQVKAERGLPKVIRADNGPEFAGRTMQTWAAKNGVELHFIQPGKPVQSAYTESFNSRFRDECLSQHWFASLSHMRSVVDNWRDDYTGHVRRAVAPARWRHCADHRINYDANPRPLDRSATKAGGSARANARRRTWVSRDEHALSTCNCELSGRSLESSYQQRVGDRWPKAFS